MILEPNQTFAGRYRLIKKIGIGGFSEVWKVADEMAEDRIVALKVYAPERGLDEHGIKQFRREYSITLDIRHPNLLNANYFDVNDGSPYLVMPFCQGGSLHGTLMDNGVFSEKELAQLLVQVCAALEHLHELEIVHQDIKPDNVLIDSKGNYLLTDFGISNSMRSTFNKSTRMPQAMTVAYAPPEKFKGNAKVGAAGDVFSLGVMCFELLTGELPWSGLGGAYLTPTSDMPVLGESCSSGLQNLLQDCLSFDPTNRPSAFNIGNAAKKYLNKGSWNESPEHYKNENLANKSKGRRTTVIDRDEQLQLDILQEKGPKVPNKLEEVMEFPLSDSFDKFAKYFLIFLVFLTIACIIFHFTTRKESQSKDDGPKNNKIETHSNFSFNDVDWKDLELFVDRDSNLSKYGFIHKKTKKTIIPAKYDVSWGFSEGFAQVAINDKWGFIDKTGKAVIPIQYDWVGNFSSGVAPVKLNGKYALINKTGRTMVVLNYAHIASFQEGLAQVQLGGKHGFIDTTGKEAIPLNYDDAGGFWEGLAWVGLKGKYGYIDKSGKLVIPYKYERAGPFSNGFAFVQNNGKKGFIDKTGKELTTLKYEDVLSFSEGFASVKLDDNWGFIDTIGRETFPLQHGFVSPFSEGLAMVSRWFRMGYIDKTGRVVIPIKFDKAENFSEGLAKVTIDNKTFYINKQGQCVIDCP